MRYLLVFFSLSILSLAGVAQEVLPLPTEVEDVVPAPMIETEQPIAVSEGATVPAHCVNPTAAKVFTITKLTDACGQEIVNSRLRGVINRLRACSKEEVVAQVIASPKTSATCDQRSHVSKIRCERAGCNVCANAEYLQALYQDLAHPSLLVRVAATRSIRDCGYRVTEVNACVEREVPSVYLY